MRGAWGQLEDFSRWEQDTNRWALSFRTALMTMGVWHFAFILIGSYRMAGAGLMVYSGTIVAVELVAAMLAFRWWIFKERNDASPGLGKLESSLDGHGTVAGEIPRQQV
jgi:hypothetical protein